MFGNLWDQAECRITWRPLSSYIWFFGCHWQLKTNPFIQRHRCDWENYTKVYDSEKIASLALIKYSNMATKIYWKKEDPKGAVVTELETIIIDIETGLSSYNSNGGNSVIVINVKSNSNGSGDSPTIPGCGNIMVCSTNNNHKKLTRYGKTW